MGIGIFVVAVALYVAIAAGSDFHLHRIPNYITVPTAILGLAYNAVAPIVQPSTDTVRLSVGLWGWNGSLAGFALGFGLLFFPWLLGGAGMGDVKLLAALGAWLGPWWLFVAFALSMVIACALALAVLLRNVAMRGVGKAKKKFTDALELTGDMGRKKSARRIVPFAVPVALGTWLVLIRLVFKGSL